MSNRNKRIKCEEKLNVSVPSELQDCSLDKDELHQRLRDNGKRYLERIRIGNEIASYLISNHIPEESLNREDKECLELFRHQYVRRLNMREIELRPWQKDAFKMFETPSERQVVWIVGCQGDEGKSWFQSYVQSYFGYHRVARVDLRIMHANVCNVIKKRSLPISDIFLFNDSRSVSYDEEINLYRILEDIKDGQATTSKDDNDNIRFKTPNTVMVFSNGYPILNKISSDHWRLYNANKDGLHDVTRKVMKINGYNS